MIDCRSSLATLQCSKHCGKKKKTLTPFAKSRAWSSHGCGLFSVTNRAQTDTSCITEMVTLYTVNKVTKKRMVKAACHDNIFFGIYFMGTVEFFVD